MKLPELKSPHILIAILAVVVAFGGIMLYNQQQQTRMIMQMLQSNARGGKGDKAADDPYDKAVKNQILKIYPAISTAYKAYTAGNPAVKEGSITVDWTIETDGSPERVQIVSSDFNDKKLEGAVIAELNRIQFPRPPFERYMTHTFRFQDASSAPKPAVEVRNTK